MEEEEEEEEEEPAEKEMLAADTVKTAADVNAASRQNLDAESEEGMEEEEAASWKDIPSSRPKEGGAIFAVLAAGPPSAFFTQCPPLVRVFSPTRQSSLL